MKYLLFVLSIAISASASVANAKEPFKSIELWPTQHEQSYRFLINNLGRTDFEVETVLEVNDRSTAHLKYQTSLLQAGGLQCNENTSIVSCSLKFEILNSACLWTDNEDDCTEPPFTMKLDTVKLEFSVNMNSIDTFSGKLTLGDGRVVVLSPENLGSIKRK